MRKVITYGTYDLLHEGHIRLLNRAKALGDYLIVGVTGEGFDRTRGKINVQQSLMERIEAVKATGLADQIIVEEYEGQKIDDIRRYDVDIFTVGSDWKGKFDYLNDFCKVIYLDRTEGISSSEIRAERGEVRIGLVGESPILNKFLRESCYVNGVSISGICTRDDSMLDESLKSLPVYTNSIKELFNHCDAVYIISRPEDHYNEIKSALSAGKHILCESPITLSVEQYDELYAEACSKQLVLMDGIKTEVFMFVQKKVPSMIKDIIEYSGIPQADIDFFMFHQPNRFMLQKLARKLKIEEERMPMNIVENFGNSSGVTVPLNICYNLGDKLLNNTYKLCMAGFGGGLVWSSVLMNVGPLGFCRIIEYPKNGCSGNR